MPQILNFFCDSAGYAGHEVSKHVFDTHSWLDCAAQARKHQEASEHILKTQDEALSTYLSAMTLSDKVSGTFQHPGGRFWSKSSTDTELTESSLHCHRGLSCHKLTDHNLCLL